MLFRSDLSRLYDTVDNIKERLGGYIYEIGNRSLPEVVFDKLSELGLTVSFAESCTGGMIGAAITDIPGSSKVFKGAVTVYSNESKKAVLGVSRELLDRYGAVSRETAEAMALSCRKLFCTDYAVAVTGVAGPGESENKPAGLVHLCLASDGGTVFRRLDIRKDRSRIRKITVLNAFDMIRKELDLK